MKQPMHPSRRQPRLEKIREMRAEIRRLDAALVRAEMLFGSDGNKPVGNFDMKAIEGWVLSLAESYVVLVHTNVPKPMERNMAMDRLREIIRSTSDKFDHQPVTVWTDEPFDPRTHYVDPPGDW